MLIIFFFKNNASQFCVKCVQPTRILYLVLSISIGIAAYNGHENNYSELIKKADIAMDKAKADPENRFYICE
ncbi:MAG: diguanylate cyclase [Clostridia bacterium]|nr:diguanylate cyclase [Clostridia bacterium]